MHCVSANLGTYQGYVQRDIILPERYPHRLPQASLTPADGVFSVDYSIEVCSAGRRVGRQYACVMVLQQGYHAHQLS